MNNKKNISYRNIFISIFFIILGLSLFFYSIKKDMNNERKYFNDVIELKKDKIGINVYIDVKNVIVPFATINCIKNEAFYLISDNNYYYIAYMNNKTYNKLISKEIDIEGYKLNGVTRKIPDNIIKLGIEAFNKVDIGIKEDINKDNFVNYFGDIYLDSVNNYKKFNVLEILSIILFTIGISMIFVYKKAS